MNERDTQSAIWQILDSTRGRYTDGADGLMLLICRNVSELDRNFDYERLFSGAEAAANFIESHNDPRLLKMVYADWKNAIGILASSTGIHRGFGYITMEASTLMLRLLDPQAGEKVFVPFGGDWHFGNFSRYDGIEFYAEEKDIKIYSYQRANLASGQNLNYHVVLADSFDTIDQDLSQYAAAYVPAMPFRSIQRGRKYKEVFILRALEGMRHDARMVIALPESANYSMEFFELRKTLLERGWIDMVFSMPPSSVFNGTASRTTIWVITKAGRRNSLKLIDGSSKDFFIPVDDILLDKLMEQIQAGNPSFCTILPYGNIWDNTDVQYRDLSSALPKRVAPEGMRFVRLKDILTSVRCPSVTVERDEFQHRLTGREMHLEFPEYSLVPEKAPMVELRFGQRFSVLTEEAFCFHGITGNFVWFKGCSEIPVYINSDVYTFQIKDNVITPEYLCFALGKDDVKEEIKARMTGVAIQRLSRRDFLNLTILVPDLSLQTLSLQEMNRQLSDAKSAAMKETKEETDERLREKYEDIADRIHLAAPYGASMQLGLYAIEMMLEEGKALDAKTEILPDRKALPLIKSIRAKSEKYGRIVANMNSDLLDDPEVVDLNAFMEEYIQWLKDDTDNFDILFFYENNAKDAKIMFNSMILEYCLESLVSNAKRHGFTGYTDMKMIKFVVNKYPDGQFIVLTVENSGNKVADGFSAELYKAKGGKCGHHAHSGRGGHYVARMLAKAGGDLYVYTTDPDWSFVVKLIIPVSYE